MTALGATASITAITAVPGSFKTTRAVWFIENAIAAGEMVYVCNLNGLKIPGVMPFEDPTKWRDLPAGSVLVVDEAQMFFRARRGGEPPRYITDMETIRHHGIRLILITQRISYLDSHVRGLIGLHEHMMREDGDPYATIVRANTCIENTDELVKRKTQSHYDHEKWTPDPALFTKFESAQVHTVKRVIKSKYKRAAVILLGVFIAFAAVYYSIFSGTTKAQTTEATMTAPSAPSSGLDGIQASRNEQKPPLTTEEYLERLVPRMVEAPFSAPIFDERAAVSQPDLYCMSSEAFEGQRASCTCLTEQGTRYEVDPRTCVLIARHGGPYNPFKAQPAATSSVSQVEPPPPIGGPPTGTTTKPGDVGSPEQGNVWGNSPNG